MLTIEDAVRVLRGWKGEQTQGVLIDAKGARCAMGVLGGEEMGLDQDGIMVFQGKWGEADFRIGECYGLDSKTVARVERWNDDRALTFAEIADRLERYHEEDSI